MQIQKNSQLSFKNKLYLVDKEPLTADIGIKGDITTGLSQQQIEKRIKHGYVNLIPGVHKKKWYEDALCCAVRPNDSQEYVSLIYSHISQKSSIIRNGKIEKISREKLLPGDVVILEPGNKVNADIQIKEINQPLKVCMDLYNGCYDKISKNVDNKPMEKPWNRPNVLLTGSLIIEGSAKGIVIAVGEQTIVGKIMKELHRRTTNSKQKADYTPSPKNFSPFNTKYDDRIKEQDTMEDSPE